MERSESLSRLVAANRDRREVEEVAHLLLRLCPAVARSCPSFAMHRGDEVEERVSEWLAGAMSASREAIGRVDHRPTDTFPSRLGTLLATVMVGEGSWGVLAPASGRQPMISCPLSVMPRLIASLGQDAPGLYDDACVVDWPGRAAAPSPSWYVSLGAPGGAALYRPAD